jgi:ABC-type thiamin/hydroxymethylpyrimidine transport system permease subunit
MTMRIFKTEQLLISSMTLLPVYVLYKKKNIFIAVVFELWSAISSVESKFLQGIRKQVQNGSHFILWQINTHKDICFIKKIGSAL